MHIDVSTRIPLARASEVDFVVPLSVDILAAGAFEDETDEHQEFLVGRIWAERLDWALAEEMGYPPAMVCDAVSAIWLNVYETLINKRHTGFRADLNLEHYYEELVFVHEFLLHPDISDRLAVLDAAITGISGSNSLVLMYHEQGLPHHVDDWEYRDLGFKKIARSSLLLRDNHLRYPFAEAHLGGREVEFAGTAEHEEWIHGHWESLLTDHPSL